MAYRKPDKFVFEKETTAGQDPAFPTAYVLAVNEISLSTTPNTATDNVIGGDIDFGGEEYTKFDDVSGGFKGPMYYEQLPVVLEAVLGAPTTTGIGPYTHTFVSTNCTGTWVGEDTLKGTCDGASDLIKRHNGLKANTFGISVSPEGDYNYNIDFVGMTGRDSLADGISALDDTNEITLAATRIKNAHASITINGTSYKLAKDFSFTINRGATAERVIDAGALVTDSQVIVTGKLSSVFDDTVYGIAKNNTSVPVVLTLTDGTSTATVTLAEAQFKFSDEPRRVGEKYPMNLTMNAFKKTGTEKIKVEVTNSVVSYH